MRHAVQVVWGRRGSLRRTSFPVETDQDHSAIDRAFEYAERVGIAEEEIRAIFTKPENGGTS